MMVRVTNYNIAELLDVRKKEFVLSAINFNILDISGISENSY